MHVRTSALVTVLAILVSTVVSPSRAQAQQNKGSVDQAIELYNDLEYAKAAALLEQALRNKSLTKDARTEALKYLGLSYVVLKKFVDAKRAFTNLVKLNPGFRLARTENPTALDLFNEVRQSVGVPDRRQAAGPQIVMSPPQVELVGAPVRMAIATGTKEARKATLYYRQRGGEKYSSVTGTPTGGGQFDLVIPGAMTAPPGMEYYVVVFDAKGKQIASRGYSSTPLFVRIEKRVKKESKPFYGKWWFWTAAGGAALAVASVFVVPTLLDSGDDSAILDITIE